jgi:hypothetical protein
MESLNEKEQDLRIQELQWKVNDLAKPAYRKVSTWTGISAILIALLGLILQGIVSSYKSEIEDLKLRELKREYAKVDSTLKLSKSSLEVARAQAIAEQGKVTEATAKFNEITELLAKLKLPEQNKNNINSIVKRPSNNCFQKPKTSHLSAAIRRQNHSPHLQQPAVLRSLQRSILTIHKRGNGV